MTEYQVLARKYRPKRFKDVIAQEAIVTTLKNAIKYKRLAHAYLFCGSRGTGKTTLARVFAKALNCPHLSDDCEPCGTCSSCKEIANGTSLDVLEIDGASHRGIDDVRQINETVGYSTSSGGYKVYIIDEVHMLTKEAFNALLKTLEEPPPKVKFLFATTEPHKVLPTILSRCQRFNLNRIPADKIVEKLSYIAADLSIQAEDEALRMIAQRAEGGLRDAESLLDQIYSFHGDNITTETIAAVLGIMPRDIFFEMDKAGKEGRLSIAFEIAHQIFSQGKDLVHFVESLVEHFRNILLVKLSDNNAPYLTMSEADRARYAATAELYSQEQCMTLLEYLVEAQNEIRHASSGRIALEAILLHVMRSHRRVPIEVLVRRLVELEQAVTGKEAAPSTHPQQSMPLPKPPPPPPPPPPVEQKNNFNSITIDPTPTAADLGQAKPKLAPTPPPPPPPPKPAVNMVEISGNDMHDQSRYDTLLQFASVELEGKLEKKQIKRT